jgi:hypothetical protein
MRLATTALASAFAICAFTGIAYAQTPDAAAPPTAGTTPAPAGATPAPADASAAAPATATAPTPAAPADDPANKLRFRFAVHIMGGPWILPDKSGGAGGIGLQLGAQINDTIGVYYAGTAAVGAGYGTAGAMVYNSIVPELTLANIFQVGAGPSYDSFAFGSVSVSNTSAKAVAIAGSFFGVQGRVGVALGSSKPGKKGRFMLGVELHPTFIPDVTPVSILITIGGGSF